MPAPVDHYEYWQRHSQRHAALLDREKTHLRLLRGVARPGQTFFDAGCGDGSFLDVVARELPELQVSGADFSSEPVRAARLRGLDVHEANFDADFAYGDDAFDIVNAAQVIEHIYNPDHFVRELHRVLKPSGALIISTPNLCAWFNRFLFPLGIQPIFYETSTESTHVGAGILRSLKRGDHPVGHLRLFTERALVDLLERHGFRIVASRGAIFDEGFPRLALYFDRLFTIRTSLSALLVILAAPRSQHGRAVP